MMLASALQFDSSFFWHELLSPSGSFLGGLWRTVYISVLAQFFAVIIGLGVALARRSSHRTLRGIGGFYVWVLRGTPLLVQLVIVYDGLAATGIYTFRDVSVFGVLVLASVQAAIVTLALNESAYMSEIIRAGLAAVDVGQHEAALSVGLTPTQVMRYVVVPQAMRFVIPPLGNDFNAMMKNTSILSVIGVPEMFLITQEISSSTFHTFEIFVVAALYYLVLTTIWSIVQSWIELKIDRSWGITRSRQSLWAGLRARIKNPRSLGLVRS
ncbi:MAG TPA: amino acid ABC transporter permease [Acidimicrobiales bacterium]|nr:amino acid ABC transporter permease [Acidimicrobiales bacterium]